MKKTKITAMVFFLLCAIGAKAQNKWYVDSSATGANNGSSWANAFKFLSDATNAARSSTSVDSIFVAKGSYYPTGSQSSGSSANRDTAFIFTRNNLAVLGGYPNGGGVRDWRANPTLLSGKINTNSSLTLNSYHIVVAVGTSTNPINNTLVLDGFRFTESIGATVQASITINTQPIYNFKGGGIYNHYASPTITNTIFSKITSSFGASIFNYHSSPIIINSIMRGNVSPQDGACLFNDSLSSPVVSNVVISGNGGLGSAIENNGLAAPHLINVTISGNRGMALVNYGTSTPVLKNCILYNQFGSVVNGNSTPSFEHCIIEGSGITNWYTYYGTNLGNNLDVNPLFVTPLPSPVDSVLPSVAGNFQLNIASPAIGKGDTTGISQYLPLIDMAGNPRIIGSSIDMGAYEFVEPSHIIYVDSSATTGNNTGESWANAFKSLSLATNFVAKKYTNIDTIFIAKGTYYAAGMQSSTRRDSFFTFTRNNLALIGGYSSGGGQRNWVKYPTILSGNVNNVAYTFDNVYHVVVVMGTTAAPLDNSLIFDGITIANGYTNYTSGSPLYDTVNGQLISRTYGANISFSKASPSLKNCTITDGSADVGGGVYVKQSNPVFTNTVFSANRTSYGGSAIFGDSANYVLSNCVISGNYSGYSSMQNNYSNATVVNSTFSGNYYSSNGSTMTNTQCSPVFKNTIIYNDSGSVAAYNYTASPSFNHCIIQHSGGSAAWTSSIGIDSGFNLDLNPNFLVPIMPNISAQTGGNLQISFGSPAMNAGDTANISQYLPAVDIWSNPRIEGSQIDIGAFEFGAPSHMMYVDSSAITGANNGTSWSNAYKSLVTATNVARFYPVVDTILVAKGTYYPTGTQAGTDRDAAFIFTRDSLVVLGGYPSGGDTVRNSNVNITTLSGNIGNSTLSTDNSHHVVLAVGTSTTPIDSTLRINGFTITGGYANIDTGALVVNTQAITRKIGGGMANFYASPSLHDIIITKDTANGNGGGIYNFHSSPIITRVSFILNTATNGGGIFDTASSPVITNTVFRGNRANNNGAGMYNIATSSPKISSSLFSGNNAASNGGGILNSTSSAPIIINTTIASNFAVNLGGGIINLANSPAIIKSSIIYANNSGITNVSSSPVVSKSIMQDGGYAGSNGNINQNPLFQTTLLATNVPSVAGNFQLLIGSPAINAGDTTAVSQYLPAHDIIGFPRILGNGIDMGGYEYVRALYVDSAIVNAGRGTSWTDAYRYLSDATNAARNVQSVDTILVAKGTYFPTGKQSLNNRDTSFIITRSGTTMLGGYPNGGGLRDWMANPTILSGDIGNVNDSTDNVYHVLLAIGASSANPITNSSKIDGFIVTGGNASNNTGTIIVNGVTIPRNFGGGMLNYFASPAISNVTITKNGANSGGGMYNSTSSPSISKTTFSANKATTAGGALFGNISTSVIDSVNIINNTSLGIGGGIATNSADLVISNALIQGNKATTTGGGLNCNLSTPAFTITNTAIVGNTATTNGGGLNIVNTGNTAALILNKSIINANIALKDGGGIANLNAAPTITNSKISGNTAGTTANNGGGIFNSTSSAIVSNSVISGNTAANGGGMANSTSAAKVINTVIAGNSATNGGGVYNIASANPIFKNSIIYTNNTGIVNATSSSVSHPVFSYSIVQASGGSGTGWIATTGTDSGYNKDVNPNFVNGIQFTAAPDTLGNYSITICSRAANMGDTIGISQYIPSLDLASAPRFNGKIDAGSYEIDTLNPASMMVPIIGGIYTSTKSFQQGNLTHYCNCDSNKLLVTLDTVGSGVVLSDSSAKLRVGNAVAAYYQAGSGFVTNPDGTAIFNREWTVIPTVEPTSPVTVYTYYTDSDYVSVNNVLNSLMLTPLTSDTQMYFYKVTDTSLGIFPSIFSIDTDQVQIITYGSAPSVNSWVAGTLGSNKYAEYKVASFSGGGGGGSAEGNSPLPIEILSLTGKAYNGYNLLNWENSNDITHWELSHSTNTTDFTVLKEGVSGVRNYKDEHPADGMNYYRLKVTSKTGKSAYSAIVALRSNAINGGVTLYPVPASQSITLRCSDNSLIGKKVMITDNVGRAIHSMILKSENNVDVSAWAAGMYYVQLPDGSSIKMVKE